MKKSNIFAIIGLVVIIGLGIWIYVYKGPSEAVSCPLDAMICPDGTPVGRTGKNCEFQACPTKPQQNITIEQPAPNAEVGLPLVVSGQARVFENALNYRLKDSDGTVLVEGFTMSSAPDMGEFGPYRVEFNYPQPKGETGTVEAFSRSAKDGSEINLVSVPVKFGAVESQIVKVYFGNRIKDPQVLDCSKVFPVNKRIAKTEAIGRTALEELLLGPSILDINQGYFTSINQGVKINSLVIDKGVAKVDFDQTLQQEVGGSCRVTAIRSQIEQTLKQFPTVKTVVLSIDGNSQDILQP